MDKKNILVTGASSGIGRETCVYLSEQGYRVIALSRAEGKLKELVQDLNSDDTYIAYDLFDFEHYEEVFKFLQASGLKLDGMVHSAGISANLPIKVKQMEMMEKQMRLNCFAFAELGRYFSKKRYSNDGASMVAISSQAAVMCDKGLAGYAASKAALNAVTQVMAKEFARRKIRVNALMPSFVDTDLPTRNSVGVSDLNEKIERNQPFGIIPPRQIAYYVEFLLSVKSDYITGSLLPVTAGYFTEWGTKEHAPHQSS